MLQLIPTFYLLEFIEKMTSDKCCRWFRLTINQDNTHFRDDCNFQLPLSSSEVFEILPCICVCLKSIVVVKTLNRSR